MKKLFNIIVLLSALSVSSFADTAVGAKIAAATATTAISSPAVVQKLVLSSTNTLPTIVYLIDGAYTTTNKAWTNVTYSSSSEVTTYINSTGTTNYQTNTVLKSTASIHAAEIVPTPAVAVVTVPPNGALITIDDPIVITRKLTLSNDIAGLNFTLTYRTP